MNQGLEYLRAVDAFARKCSRPCAESWVLRNGEPFEAAPLTDLERKVVADAARRHRFPPRMCFENAQTLVLSDRTATLKYVEGFASVNSLPVLHGWATINGKVVDMTWRTASGGPIMGEFTGFYFGATFTMQKVLEQQTSTCSSLIDDWSRGWPLLAEMQAQDPEWAHLPERDRNEVDICQ